MLGKKNNLDFLCWICYHIYCKHIFILQERIGRNPQRKKHEITSHSHATRGFCTSQGRYKRHIIVDFGITYQNLRV